MRFNQPEYYDSLRNEFDKKREQAEQWFAEGRYPRVDCELCGEPADEEMGEFVKPNSEHVFAHAQCGIDQHLDMA